MKTRLVIFDLDGTLLNTVRDLGHATNHALRQCGFPERPIDDYYQLCGRGIRNMFIHAVPQGCDTEENIGKITQYFLSYYDAHMCDETRPYPGISELLDNLAAEGISVALASNKYQEGAEKLMSHFFADIPFVKILGQREGQPLKPDPAIVSQIMEQVPDISKAEVMYVGDSNVDMQTGRNAGVCTVGVSWGFRSVEELQAEGPWRIANDADDLKNFIFEEKMTNL